jgi:putative flippase GtrA
MTQLSRLLDRLQSPFALFLISGGIAAAVNILSRIALSEVMSYGASIAIAYLVGMTTAYLLMKLLVFEKTGKAVWQEYIRFGLVNAVALAQVWIVSLGLAEWILPAVGWLWHAETLAHVAGVMSPVVTSYAAHKHFTFARQ